MEGFVGKMEEVDIRGCISKHMMWIEVNRGFKVREESTQLSNLSLSC
jgi:hypothetical protein